VRAKAVAAHVRAGDLSAQRGELQRAAEQYRAARELEPAALSGERLALADARSLPADPARGAPAARS
jgi:hypothetical protein